MDQRELISRIKDRVKSDERLVGLFLAGSFGRDTADEFSDVDLVAVVDPDDQASFATSWQPLLEEIAHVVFWQRRTINGLLLNAVTTEWLRCDLYIVSREDVGRRPQSSLRVLLDPRGIFPTLPLRAPAYVSNRVQVQSLFEQFIRVLGLLPVGVGRKEFHVSVTGAAILRGYLIDLFLEELEVVDKGGVQQLNRALTPDQMDALERLPCPQPNRESIVEFFLACARIFLSEGACAGGARLDCVSRGICRRCARTSEATSRLGRVASLVG